MLVEWWMMMGYQQMKLEGVKCRLMSSIELMLLSYKICLGSVRCFFVASNSEGFNYMGTALV